MFYTCKLLVYDSESLIKLVLLSNRDNENSWIVQYANVFDKRAFQFYIIFVKQFYCTFYNNISSTFRTIKLCHSTYTQRSGKYFINRWIISQTNVIRIIFKVQVDGKWCSTIIMFHNTGNLFRAWSAAINTKCC